MLISGTRMYNRLVNKKKKKTNIDSNIFISPYFNCLEGNKLPKSKHISIPDFIGQKELRIIIIIIIKKTCPVSVWLTISQ
jgi:hypothetical protein